jgi:saccharopine dehydrogenase (NAD+, L-lysine-forming)
MKNNSILLLGGYGAVGRTFARLLLKETEADIVIAGRRKEKADAFAEKLKNEFPSRTISSSYANACEPDSLRTAFRSVNLIIVLTTTPQFIRQIGKAALEENCDYLDILVSESTIKDLAEFAPLIKEKNRIFITQAGFHPGLPAVFVRFGAQYFDVYKKAVIAMAMNARFETSEQAAEIVPLITEFKTEIYQKGSWRKTTYKDAIKLSMGKRFGDKSLFPIQMDEIKLTQKMFNLEETGVYVSGFNWVTDYFVMPIILLTQKIKKGLAINFILKLFTWSVNKFSSPYQGVVFLNEAEGTKNGKKVKVRISAEHDDAYLFTAIPVIACLKQYLAGSLQSGLSMMGHAVDEKQLFADMEKMGVDIKVEIKEE